MWKHKLGLAWFGAADANLYNNSAVALNCSTQQKEKVRKFGGDVKIGRQTTSRQAINLLSTTNNSFFVY